MQNHFLCLTSLPLDGIPCFLAFHLQVQAKGCKVLWCGVDNTQPLSFVSTLVCIHSVYCSGWLCNVENSRLAITNSCSCVRIPWKCLCRGPSYYPLDYSLDTSATYT